MLNTLNSFAKTPSGVYHKSMEENKQTQPDSSTLSQEAEEVLSIDSAAEAEGKPLEEGKKQTLLMKLQQMKVGEKIQLAMKGGREIRSILIRDTSKEISTAVLENLKITLSEIEILAKQKTTPEELLRIISKNREWIKNYSIMLALVTNPKTPPGVALSFIRLLKRKDLELISKNKSVPEVVRVTAKKLADERRV